MEFFSLKVTIHSHDFRSCVVWRHRGTGIGARGVNGAPAEHRHRSVVVRLRRAPSLACHVAAAYVLAFELRAARLSSSQL